MSPELSVASTVILSIVIIGIFVESSKSKLRSISHKCQTKWIKLLSGKHSNLFCSGVNDRGKKVYKTDTRGVSSS